MYIHSLTILLSFFSYSIKTTPLSYTSTAITCSSFFLHHKTPFSTCLPSTLYFPRPFSSLCASLLSLSLLPTQLSLLYIFLSFHLPLVSPLTPVSSPHQVLQEGNMSRSSYNFSPGRMQDGARITCRAENPVLKGAQAMEDTRSLGVLCECLTIWEELRHVIL